MKKLVKKLKFWSKRKKRKKSQETYITVPVSHQTCHCCCSCSSTQPSAPPLPPWYDLQQNQDPVSGSGIHPVPEMVYPNEGVQFPNQEISADTAPMYPSSYQQYTVPNPVYGLPVMSAPRRERSEGAFGCVVNSGAHLIRCFCPCFRIRKTS